MKKFLAVLMAVVMMATMATFAMAAENPSFKITGKYASEANSVEVAVTYNDGYQTSPSSRIAVQPDKGALTIDWSQCHLTGDTTITVQKGYCKYYDYAPTGTSFTIPAEVMAENPMYIFFNKGTEGFAIASGTNRTENIDYSTFAGIYKFKNSVITISGTGEPKFGAMDQYTELAEIRYSYTGTDVSATSVVIHTDSLTFVLSYENGALVYQKCTSPLTTADEKKLYKEHITDKGITMGSVFEKVSDAPPAGTSPTENPANDPKTTEQVAGAIAALADPAKELPKEAERTTTAGGAAVTVIPVQLSSGAAALDVATANLVGNGSKAVGLQASVDGGAMVVTMPGGFGAVTEPGRLYYPLDYSKKAPEAEAMLAAVRGADASSDTMKVGANMTMPTAVSVDVETNLADGAMANIYHYNPETGVYTFLGKHKVNAGRVAFMTKLMGQMLMTTGTI